MSVLRAVAETWPFFAIIGLIVAAVVAGEWVRQRLPEWTVRYSRWTGRRADAKSIAAFNERRRVS